MAKLRDFKSKNNHIVTELIWRKAHLTSNIQVLLDILSTQADPALCHDIQHN